MLREEILKEEYIHLVSELARYDNEGGRIISLFSGFIILAFGIGVSGTFSEMFLAIPFLTLLALQTISTNHYAYHVREIYLSRLEKFLKNEKSIYPGFYGFWIPKCYHIRRFWAKLFAPFNLNIHIFVLISAIVITYSWEMGKNILESKLPQAEPFFSIVVLIGCQFVFVSWILMHREVAILKRTSSELFFE